MSDETKRPWLMFALSQRPDLPDELIVQVVDDVLADVAGEPATPFSDLEIARQIGRLLDDRHERFDVDEAIAEIRGEVVGFDGPTLDERVAALEARAEAEDTWQMEQRERET